MADVHFSTIAIIGVGLIGSSLLHGIRELKLADRTVGIDQSQAVQQRVEELGLVDDVRALSAESVADADLVILAVPVGAMADVAKTIAPGLRPGTIVTDVGSVKTAVMRDVAGELPDGVHFVPGHPIAGTEQSGPDAGFAEVFHGRWCILTPDASADLEAVQKVGDLWRALGSDVEIMSTDHHDLVLAVTSHLPHLIAYNLVSTASDMQGAQRAEVIKFSASGFRDFTRIAASDPTMWRDIFLNNRSAVLKTIEQFTSNLAELRSAIVKSDGDALFDLFTHTRTIRGRIIDAGQDTPDIDFGRQHGVLESHPHDEEKKT